VQVAQVELDHLAPGRDPRPVEAHLSPEIPSVYVRRMLDEVEAEIGESGEADA
jgi:hypothetical protein